MSALLDAVPDPIEQHVESMRQRGLSEATIRHRRYDLQRLQVFLGRDDLLSASVEEMEAWRASLSQTLNKAGSIHRNVSYVQQFFRWAHARGLIPTDPTAGLLLPKIPRRLPRPISEEKLAVVLDNAPQRLLPWLILAAYAGLRACEVASLACEDVVTGADVPHLRIVGKGDKERAVPMSAIVLDHLAPIVASRQRFVFPRGDGQPGHVSAGQVSTLANECLRDLGYRDTFHSLRHRFGTVIYQQTKDLRLVQELMGHVDPGTTAVYAALDPLAAAKAVWTLGGEITDSPAAKQKAPPLVLDVLQLPAPQTPFVWGVAAEPVAESRAIPSPWGELKPPSEREVSLLRLLAEGMANSQIASELGIAEGTVKSHLKRIGQKLGKRDRAAMVAVAFRTGLIR